MYGMLVRYVGLNYDFVSEDALSGRKCHINGSSGLGGRCVMGKGCLGKKYSTNNRGHESQEYICFNHLK